MDCVLQTASLAETLGKIIAAQAELDRQIKTLASILSSARGFAEFKPRLVYEYGTESITFRTKAA